MELGTDGEHEQHDAKLGKELEGVDIRDCRSGRERIDEDAAQDISDNQRLSGKVRENPTENCRRQDDAQIDKESGLFHRF